MDECVDLGRFQPTPTLALQSITRIHSDMKSHRLASIKPIQNVVTRKTRGGFTFFVHVCAFVTSLQKSFNSATLQRFGYGQLV